MKVPIYFPILALVATACGDVWTPTRFGEPLYVVRSRFNSTMLQEPQGEYRAIVAWAQIEDGAMVRCAEQGRTLADFYGCLDEPVRILIETTRPPIEPGPLNAINVSIHSVPDTFVPPMVGNEPFIAMAVLAVYDDVNLNGVPDVELTAGTAAPLERIVAISHLPDIDRRPISTVVYHGGVGTHPLWRLFAGLSGCGEEPPSGFATVRIEESGGCAIGNDAMVSLHDASDGDQLLMCSRFGTSSNFRLRPAFERPDEPIPPQHEVICESDGQDLIFYPRPSRGFCPTDAVRAYSLIGDREAGTSWNLSEQTPAWWPCPRT